MNSHPTFVRVDLPTSDVARAARFYGNVFGWTFEHSQPRQATRSSPPVATSALTGRGAPGDDRWLDIAPEVGLVEVGEIPPAGGVAVAVGVDSIAGAFARIEHAGGRRVHGPEVIDDIRTAVFADCEGNEIGLWSPGPEADFPWRPHQGASVVDGATFQYVQLQATMLQRAARFYGEVFGWEFTPPHESHAPTGPVPSAGQALYGRDVVLYCNDGRPQVGLLKVERVASSAGIRVAVGVDSTSAALDRIERAGGKVLLQQAETRDAHVAMFADSEGNEVSLLAPSSGRPVAWTPHRMSVGSQP